MLLASLQWRPLPRCTERQQQHVLAVGDVVGVEEWIKLRERPRTDWFAPPRATSSGDRSSDRGTAAHARSPNPERQRRREPARARERAPAGSDDEDDLGAGGVAFDVHLKDGGGGGGHNMGRQDESGSGSDSAAVHSDRAAQSDGLGQAARGPSRVRPLPDDSSDEDFADPIPGSLKRQRRSGTAGRAAIPDATHAHAPARAGDVFSSRRRLRESGVHRDFKRYIAGNGATGATSILLADAMGTIQDKGNTVTYTEFGGSGTEALGNIITYTADGGSSTEVLGGSDYLLHLAYERVSAVRMIRSHRLSQSPYAPLRGLRYDGVYNVSRMEHVPRSSGSQLCLKFTFERIKGQPRLPVRAAPATATSNIARMARRPVFVNLLEPDERPRVWARSPTPDDTRAPGGSWGRETREEDSSMRDMADDGSQASDGGWDGARNGGWEGTMGGAHAGRMPQAPGGAREGATSGGWEGARNEGRDDAPGGVWESAIGGAHAGRLPQRPSGGREGGGRESGGREGARGDGTSGARAGRLTPPRARERPRMPTARRAARGFPRAGVIGSPSAPRLGPTVPSHGYRRQRHQWGYGDGGAPSPSDEFRPWVRRRFEHDSAGAREPHVHEQGRQRTQRDSSRQAQRPSCPREAPEASHARAAASSSESEREPFPGEGREQQPRQRARAAANLDESERETCPGERREPRPRQQAHAAPNRGESERQLSRDERRDEQAMQQASLHAVGAAGHRQSEFSSDVPEARPLLDLSTALRSLLPSAEQHPTLDEPTAMETDEPQVGRSTIAADVPSGDGLASDAPREDNLVSDAPRGDGLASERQAAEASSSRLAQLMPHHLLCHFCLRFCMGTPGTIIAGDGPAFNPPNVSPLLPRVECATCRDVVCVECIRQLFAPSVSASQLTSLLQSLAGTHASLADQTAHTDEAQARADESSLQMADWTVCINEAQAREGESFLQTRLRQLSVFLGRASGRWVCPKCDAKCACQTNTARGDATEAAHHRHLRKRWPCPPLSHECWRGAGQSGPGPPSFGAAGLAHPLHRPGDRQTILNFAPGADVSYPSREALRRDKQRNVRSRRRHGGERSLRDVEERKRQNLPVTSDSMERWLGFLKEHARQIHERERQMQNELRQQQAGSARRGARDACAGDGRAARDGAVGAEGAGEPARQQPHVIDLGVDESHGPSSVGTKRSTAHAPSGATYGPEGGVKRRKEQPMRDAVTPPMPPPRLCGCWRLASLAPPWHATAGGMASIPGDGDGDATCAANGYIHSIRKELKSALDTFLFCSPTPAMDSDRFPSVTAAQTTNEGGATSAEGAAGLLNATAGGSAALSPAGLGEESTFSTHGQLGGTEASVGAARPAKATAAEADFVEAKAAAIRKKALADYMGSLQRVHSRVEGAVRHLSGEATDAILAAMIDFMKPAECVRPFPSMLEALLMSSPATPAEAGCDDESTLGRLHLQLHWLMLEWIDMASVHMGDMGESTQSQLRKYAGGVIDDLLPLFVFTPRACTFPSACTGSQLADAPPPAYIGTVDRPILALWLHLQQSIDRHCAGKSNQSSHPSTPFWALLNERLLVKGAMLRTVARSATRQGLQPAPKGAAADCDILTSVSLRSRTLCLASLLPLYSLDAQGMPLPDGVERPGRCNWALLDRMLRSSCLNPKQPKKLGYGASEDSIAAATQLLRLCCDLSTEWEPNFNLAFEVWKWSPPPTVMCSSTRADHRFPPFTQWKEEVPFGDPARPTWRLAAAAWAETDDCRMLALRFLATQLFNLPNRKGALSKLMSWADRGPMNVCCPETHRGRQADSMRQRGCVDELWSTSASFLLAASAEMPRSGPATLIRLANKIVKMLPLNGSSLCAGYIVIEALLHLFRRVQESAADVTPIAASLNSILQQLSHAVGVPASSSPLAAGPGATGSSSSTTTTIRPHVAGELLLYLLVNMASLIEHVRNMPPTPGADASGEAVLLSEPLAMLARYADPRLCFPALRVVEVAIDTALSNPLLAEQGADEAAGQEAGQGAGADAMDEDDPFRGLDLDDAKIRAAQKLDKFRRECTDVLTSVWRGGEVLHEHFTIPRWTSRPGNEKSRQEMTHEVLRTWARMQAFLLNGMPQEARLRALDRHKLLKEEALVRFTDARVPATARELCELRTVPMQFFCCLLKVDPELAPTVLRHFSEAMERLWLAAMIEPACLDSRYGQRQFTHVLRATIMKHAVPTAPVLMVLAAIPSELLANTDSFQRIDLLTVVVGDMARQLGPHPPKEALARMELLLHFACKQLHFCNLEFSRAWSAIHSTGLGSAGGQRALDQFEGESKQYAYFACWLARTLVEKLPQVVLAGDGYVYEWLVVNVLQEALDGSDVYPALQKQAASHLREILVLLTNLSGRDDPRTTKTLDVIFREGLSIEPPKQRTAVSRDELLRALHAPSLGGLASRQLQYVLLPRLFLPRGGLQPSKYASRVAIARDTLAHVLQGYLAIAPKSAAPLFLPSQSHERTLYEVIIPSLLSALIDSLAIDQAAAIYLSLLLFQELTPSLLPRSVLTEQHSESTEPAAPGSTVLHRMSGKDAEQALEVLVNVYLRMAAGAAACSTSSRNSNSSRWLWAEQKRVIDEDLGRLQRDLQTRYPQVPCVSPPSLPQVPPQNLPADPRLQYAKCLKCLPGLIRLLQQATHCGGMSLLSRLGKQLQSILDACVRIEHASPGAMHKDVCPVMCEVMRANSQALGLQQPDAQPLPAPIAAPRRQPVVNPAGPQAIPRAQPLPAPIRAPPRPTADPRRAQAFSAGGARHSAFPAVSAPRLSATERPVAANRPMAAAARHMARAERPMAMANRPPMATPNSAELIQPGSRYKDQREKLSAMGFADDNRNLSFLMMTGGDIGRAIDKLTHSA